MSGQAFDIKHIDVSQYSSWPKVTADNGHVYYVPPGGEGYLYDPFLNHFFSDPRAAAAASKKTADAAKNASSPEMQIGIPVAVAAGTVGITQGLAHAWPVETTADKLLAAHAAGLAKPVAAAPVAPAPVAATPAQPVAATPSQQFTNAATATPVGGQSVAAVPSAGATPVQTLSDGSVAYSDGTIVAPNSTTAPVTPVNAPTTSGVTGAQVGEGVAGAAQLYGGYQQWKSGDKVGGGLGIAAGGTGVAAAAGSQTAAQYLPYVGAAYGAYTLGHNIMNGGDLHRQDAWNTQMSDANAGAAIGTAFAPGIGTAIGAIAGSLFGWAQGLSASTKGQRQVIRDGFRKSIIDNGVTLFDSNYQGTQADGSTFDWGKDKFGFGKNAGDINLDDPATAKAAAYGNALAAILGTDSGQAGQAIATQFTGAATANANGDLSTVQANYKHYLNQLGIDPITGQAAIDKALADGKISQAEHDIYSHDFTEFAGGTTATPTKDTKPTNPGASPAPVNPTNPTNQQQTAPPGTPGTQSYGAPAPVTPAPVVVNNQPGPVTTGPGVVPKSVYMGRSLAQRINDRMAQQWRR